MSTSGRIGRVERNTKETSISVFLDLDGTGKSNVSTGISFLDHMLDALSKHSKIDLSVEAKGDLHIVCSSLFVLLIFSPIQHSPKKITFAFFSYLFSPFVFFLFH